MRGCRLHIAGASGTGTTTLGRALADAWSVPHADADDYFWIPTVPPYKTKRQPAERVELMQLIFAPREAWVLSGSMLGWGEPVLDRCDAVVFLSLQQDIRLARLEARERLRGVRTGADGRSVDPAHLAFTQWASRYDDPDFDGRSRARHLTWLAGLSCPVLQLDSDAPVASLARRVLEWMPDALGEPGGA